MRYLARMTGCLLLLLLAACGSGGTPPPSAPPPQTGLLIGSGASSAAAALPSLIALPASAGDMKSGYLLSRIEVVLAPGVTISQFNAAAEAIGATDIASAQTGSPVLVLAVPRQADVPALISLVSKLKGQPGVVFAMPSRQYAVSVLPEATPGVPVAPESLGHLLISRFPQAWNARGAAGTDCLPHSVLVYVWDDFGQSSLRTDFATQFDASSFLAGAVAQLDPNDPENGHGYDVVLTLGGKFNGQRPTGALPFANCLIVKQVEAANRGFNDAILFLTSMLASEGRPKFILNASFGYPEPQCGPAGVDPCSTATLATLPAPVLKEHIRQRVMSAAYWAARTRTMNLEQRMLITLAAGNVDDNPSIVDGPAGFIERRYLGFRDARFVSPMSLATHLAELQVLLTDPSLWKSVSDPGAPDATFSAAEASDLLAKVQAFAGNTSLPGSNLIIVDSATCTPLAASPAATSCTSDFADARRSDFDYVGADLRAVGEHIQIDNVDQLEGTSFAAPQVAGLAAYLWTLSDALEAQPVAATIDLLKKTGRTNDPTQPPVIDALAATLQLDYLDAARPLRIRRAMLDINGDGVFDLLDLQLFSDALGLADPSRPSIPSRRDFSRFDLNGDGATGGIPIARLDLDVSNLDANGRPAITAVTAEVEKVSIPFNEATLSDREILCYYAYVGLPPGNLPILYESRPASLAERSRLLGADQCVRAQMTVALPPQLTSATNVAVTVKVPSGNGVLAPAPNVLIELTPTCSSVNPASGRTDAGGALVVSVTPNAGCKTVSLDVVARADTGTTPISQQNVSAQVTGVGSAYSGTLTRTTASAPSGGTSNSFITLSVSMQSDVNGDLTLVGASGTRTRTGTGTVPCFKPPNMTQSTLTLATTSTDTISGANLAGSLRTGVSIVPLVVATSGTVEVKISINNNDPATFDDCQKTTSSFQSGSGNPPGGPIAAGLSNGPTSVTFSADPMVDSSGNTIGFDFSVPAHNETQPNGVVVNVAFGGLMR